MSTRLASIRRGKTGDTQRYSLARPLDAAKNSLLLLILSRQAMTTTTSPKPRPKKWTNTNSDEQCLSEVRNPVGRALYVLSLKTGFYSIERLDRRLSLVILGFLLMVSTLMVYVLGQGVRDGWRAAAEH